MSRLESVAFLRQVYNRPTCAIPRYVDRPGVPNDSKQSFDTNGMQLKKSAYLVYAMGSLVCWTGQQGLSQSPLPHPSVIDRQADWKFQLMFSLDNDRQMAR